MARPKTKQELLDLSEKNFKRLSDFIGALPVEKQKAEFTGETMNRNIRDVLTHLHHWHMMLRDWYEVGMSGKKPDMPAKGYTWKTTPALNRKIWEDYQSVSLEEARSMLDQSYQDTRRMIEGLSNEELFEKKRYTWTGSTSVGSYMVSATSSHYDWAYKLIKKNI